MKVLIASDWYTPSTNGVVTAILILKRELEKRGHDVRVITLSDDLNCKFVRNIYYVPAVGVSFVYPNARIAYRIPRFMLQHIVKWGPDVIHSQCDVSTNYIAKLVWRITKSKFLYTYHTSYPDYMRYVHLSKYTGELLFKKVFSKIIDSADSIITPSVKAKNELVGYGVSKPVNVIPTGIELKKFHNISRKKIEEIKGRLKIPQRNFVALYVGRLASEKSISELLHYLSLTSEKHISFVIVGDGPKRRELTNYAAKLVRNIHVVFTGMVEHSHIEECYAIADVFLSASTTETQGLTYIEALASGVPVLCKKDESINHLIIDNYNGCKYSCYQEFIEFFLHIKDDMAYRQKVKNNARKSSEAYSASNYCDEMLELYYELTVRKERG